MKKKDDVLLVIVDLLLVVRHLEISLTSRIGLLLDRAQA